MRLTGAVVNVEPAVPNDEAACIIHLHAGFQLLITSTVELMGEMSRGEARSPAPSAPAPSSRSIVYRSVSAEASLLMSCIKKYKMP